MIVWHCCSFSKLEKYKKTGKILAPVRTWKNIEQAVRMGISTGRRIILRLKFPNNAPKLESHFNKARVLYSDLEFKNF